MPKVDDSEDVEIVDDVTMAEGYAAWDRGIYGNGRRAAEFWYGILPIGNGTIEYCYGNGFVEWKWEPTIIRSCMESMLKGTVVLLGTSIGEQTSWSARRDVCDLFEFLPRGL